MGNLLKGLGGSKLFHVDSVPKQVVRMSSLSAIARRAKAEAMCGRRMMIPSASAFASAGFQPPPVGSRRTKVGGRIAHHACSLDIG